MNMQRIAELLDIKVIANLLIAIGKALGGLVVEKPVLKSRGRISGQKATALLLDVVASMGDNMVSLGGKSAEIYLPDVMIKTYRKADVLNSEELEEVDAIKYTWTDQPISREISITYKDRDYKEMLIRAGEYHLHLDCADSEYLWKKVSHMKDIAFKTYHFISTSNEGGFSILK